MSAAPVVIAEAGVNHNGDIGRAIAMVDAAAVSGGRNYKITALPRNPSGANKS